MNFCYTEELDEGNAFIGGGRAPMNMVNSSVAYEITHLGLKHFTCAICGKDFSTGSHLIAHCRSHTNQHVAAAAAAATTAATTTTSPEQQRISAGADVVTTGIGCAGNDLDFDMTTEETRNGAATSDEAPGTMNTTPFSTTLQGAVFGAPTQTQEQSMQLPYPVDDLVRIHPKLFADPYDLAAMITLYVECLPSRLVEGMALFSFMFSAMLMDACRDERPRSASPTGRTVTVLVTGGCTSSRAYPQLLSMNFSSPMTAPSTLLWKVARKGARTSSPPQKVVMHQPPPPNTTTSPDEPQISVNGTQLQMVENFPYLGTTLSCYTKIDDEVARRISKAS
ncbi:hypothetical protein SprV_0100138600 [Sparganum proliferum]